MEASTGLRCVECNVDFWGRFATPSFTKHCKEKHKEKPYPVPQQLTRAPNVVCDVAGPSGAMGLNVPVVDVAVTESADDGVEQLHDTEVGAADEEEVQEAVDEFVWATLNGLNKGSGLSNGDVESVLDMIARVTEAGCGTTLRTMNQWKAYSDKKVEAASGWLISPKNMTTIRITNADVPDLNEAVLEFPFYYEDMEHFLKTEFSRKEYQGRFVMHSLRQLVSVSEVGKDESR